jgi:hypothetical protein
MSDEISGMDKTYGNASLLCKKIGFSQQKKYVAVIRVLNTGDLGSARGSQLRNLECCFK